MVLEAIVDYDELERKGVNLNNFRLILRGEIDLSFNRSKLILSEFRSKSER